MLVEPDAEGGNTVFSIIGQTITKLVHSHELLNKFISGISKRSEDQYSNQDLDKTLIIKYR